jgi:hypothetical protein
MMYPEPLPARDLAIGRPAGAALALSLAALGVCGCQADPIQPPPATTAGNAVLPPVTAPDASAITPTEAPMRWGGLEVGATAAEQNLDLFGVPGHRFWLDVSDEQLERMNAEQGSLFEAFAAVGMDGDIYTPTGPGAATFADHVVIRDAVTGSVADYGKLEVALVGQSTSREWTLDAIPSLRIDSDEFEKGKRIGGFEHIRLNNSLLGSIFREATAHRVYRELGYPALRASFAFLGSNVWGDDIWVPMTLIEVYKRRFCEDNAALLGGVCPNMWEFEGDIGAVGIQGGVSIPDADLPDDLCQVQECDHARLRDLQSALRKTPRAPGFAAALADIVDWDRFHQFQCIGWIMATGDDPVHNGNNNLLIEREDHRLMWAPYSVDASAGQWSYPIVPLLGNTTLAAGCQVDPDCWSATVTSCDALIERFDALDPERFVDETVSTLTTLGMMRDGDEARAQELRAWLALRQSTLAAELERFRILPDLTGECPNELMVCGDGGCGSAQACSDRQCQPGMTFCEPWQRCVFEDSGCPTCEEDATAPFYCPPVLACVAALESCTTSACGGAPDTVYCPPVQSCTGSAECDMLGSVPGAGAGFRAPQPGR